MLEFSCRLLVHLSHFLLLAKPHILTPLSTLLNPAYFHPVTNPASSKSHQVNSLTDLESVKTEDIEQEYQRTLVNDHAKGITIISHIPSFWTIDMHCYTYTVTLWYHQAKKKNMCVSDFPTDSPFSRRPTQVFLLCDSKFFYWGSYRKKNEVNRTTLREVMRVWRQNFLKWVQIFEEKSHSRTIKKYFTLFSNTDSVFVLCDSKFFYWGSYIKKNDVNRTTLREVLRILSQNLSKISHKDNKKILQKKKNSRPTYSVL